MNSIERDFQEILGDGDFKLGQTFYLKRKRIVNKVGVSRDLKDLTPLEMSVGVFLGVLASDPNVEGVVFQRIVTSDVPSWLFIMKKTDPNDDQSKASYHRVTQAMDMLQVRADQFIHHQFCETGERRFSDVSRLIRRKIKGLPGIELCGIIRFK